MPRARSSFTQWMMSLTVRARCWIPAPRSSSQKMLIWELRKNATAYDAAYLALAECLGATLVTRDARLARVRGVAARVEVP